MSKILPSPPPNSNPSRIISSYEARVLALREVREYTQHLSGRVKTIVDASVVDPTQRKALKDLLHEAMWGSYEKVMVWVERQIEVERKMGHQTEAWFDVHWSGSDNVAPTSPEELFNVFPFGVRHTPETE